MNVLNSTGSDGALFIALARGAPIISGRFASRPNRFVIEAVLESGKRVEAHCADRGRLTWLKQGMPLLLAVCPGGNRRTEFQAAAAWVNGGWASLDTHLPNRLVGLALREKALPPFASHAGVRSEYRFAGSRFDFLLSEPDCYLEVKSVGISHAGVGLFPDAPSERGNRHVQTLTRLRLRGVRTAVVFVAQHAGAREVVIDRGIDSTLATSIEGAMRAGVEFYAYRAPLEIEGITLGSSIPFSVGSA